MRTSRGLLTGQWCITQTIGASNSKITESSVVVGKHNNGLWRNVAMPYSLGMDVEQASDDLCEDMLDIALRKHLASQFLCGYSLL